MPMEQLQGRKALMHKHCISGSKRELPKFLGSAPTDLFVLKRHGCALDLRLDEHDQKGRPRVCMGEQSPSYRCDAYVELL